MTCIRIPLLLSFLFLFCFFQCRKNTEERKNIWLKDKPLSEIKAAIKGKWQLHYSYGGITGHIRQNHTNSFIEFTATDSIYWNDNNQRIVADILKWNKRRDVVGDDTYIMSFCEMRSSVCYPYAWGVEQIHNDTLILYDDATDAMGHYLTRY